MNSLFTGFESCDECSSVTSSFGNGSWSSTANISPAGKLRRKQNKANEKNKNIQFISEIGIKMKDDRTN